MSSIEICKSVRLLLLEEFPTAQILLTFKTQCFCGLHILIEKPENIVEFDEKLAFYSAGIETIVQFLKS